jgi:putative methyltransferase
LLLAKRGISLPAVHGLRASIERHKNRLQAEFTRARIRRKLGSIEAFKAHVEDGMENDGDTSDAPYPRWVRINSLKTSIEEQLETTFKGLDRATTVEAVRQRSSKRLFIDNNIPNLFAVSPNVDLSKSEAYKSGAIIFQDKASCFPAYLLDPCVQDGDIIDSCSAPGNKTTHLAAIMIGHSPELDECSQTLHAFEKNKGRAETLEKMVNLAGSNKWTILHPGQDFLRTDPLSPVFKNVGALLLDPSCSGSGIIGRDDMPELHLPVLKQIEKQGSKNNKKKGAKAPEPSKESKKRKHEELEALDVMVDDDGEVTAVNSEAELKTRLEALSKFQLELLIHAFKFPGARKITYSTCSIHAEENEIVVQKALAHPIAKERGWCIQGRKDQISGMKEWPVRGSREACGGHDDVADACIRANKDDEHGTMGFFLAGFVRKDETVRDIDAGFLRDERGHLIRDVMGFPVQAMPEDSMADDSYEAFKTPQSAEGGLEEGEEWGGIEDYAPEEAAKSVPGSKVPTSKGSKAGTSTSDKKVHSTNKKRPLLGIKQEKKRKKSKN